MNDEHEKPANSANDANRAAPGYETTDVGARFVPVFAVTVIIGALLLLPGLWWMFTAMLARSQSRQPAVSPLAIIEKDRLPAQPRLEGIEPAGLAAARQAANEKILQSYGWVDQKEQIVRIPIDRAMDIAAGTQHGVSKKESGQSPNQFEMPGSSNSGRMIKKQEVSP